MASKNAAEDREPTPEERAKTVAETAKTEQETAKTVAELEALRAEERRKEERHRLELQGLKAAAEAAKSSATLADIQAKREQRLEKIELAQDVYHFTYSFSDPVSARTVRECINTLSNWERQADKSLEITLIFDSPGGSVIDGMHLFDYLTLLRSRGHVIKTVALGMAASMAGILLQAGTTRTMGNESYLLVHEVSFGAGGKIGEVEDEVAFVKKIQKRVLDIFADRAAKAYIARGDATEEQYEALFRSRRARFAKNWERKDWWLDSQEAYAEGLIDATTAADFRR